MASKLTPELLEKAKQAKSAEELIALVKENGVEIPEDKAKALFEKLKGALSDEELDGVSGGGLTDCYVKIMEMYLAHLNRPNRAIAGEVSDDELDQVAGGCDDGEPIDYRVKVSPTDEACMYYACGICEQSAGTCKCRSCAESNCGTCLHIRYKGDGSALCNSLNVHEGRNRYT